MKKITVNGVSLEYEILGDGLPIAWSSGAFGSLEVGRPYAERLSSNYRVLIYSLRNRGSSDIAITGDRSEWEIFPDDLHELLQRLDMAPAYLGGNSGGMIVTLATAYRYPEDVRGLLLNHPPTDDIELWRSVAENFYPAPDGLEDRGMQAVTEVPLWSARIERIPAARERLLGMDATQFAQYAMREVAYVTSGRFHFGSLTDEQLRSIEAPAIIIPGRDGSEGLHPQHTPQELHRLLPHSELVRLSELFSPVELEEPEEIEDEIVWDRECAMFDSFIQRVETEKFSAS